jgi:hypothetical protein
LVARDEPHCRACLAGTALLTRGELAGYAEEFGAVAVLGETQEAEVGAAQRAATKTRSAVPANCVTVEEAVRVRGASHWTPRRRPADISAGALQPGLRDPMVVRRPTSGDPR